MAMAESVREERMRGLLKTVALPGDPVTRIAIAAGNEMGKRIASLLLSMISSPSLFCVAGWPKEHPAPIMGVPRPSSAKWRHVKF